MRRAVAVALVVVSCVAVAFGVGWFASSTDDHATVSVPTLEAFEPLPVPEVIILNGPWADPLPQRVRTINHLTRDVAGSIVEDIYRVLGLGPPTFTVD